MLSRPKVYYFSWLLLGLVLVVVACGDATATIAPPANVATATSVPTIPPTTVAAPATATATKAPVATTAAATTAAVANANASSSTDTLDVQKAAAGGKVFVVQCQLCHLNGGKSSGGVGPNLALSRKAINPDRVREFVRKGQDAMPAFDQTKISDADLESIIVYLKSIHQD